MVSSLRAVFVAFFLLLSVPLSAAEESLSLRSSSTVVRGKESVTLTATAGVVPEDFRTVGARAMLFVYQDAESGAAIPPTKEGGIWTPVPGQIAAFDSELTVRFSVVPSEHGADTIGFMVAAVDDTRVKSSLIAVEVGEPSP